MLNQKQHVCQFTHVEGFLAPKFALTTEAYDGRSKFPTSQKWRFWQKGLRFLYFLIKFLLYFPHFHDIHYVMPLMLGRVTSHDVVENNFK